MKIYFFFFFFRGGKPHPGHKSWTCLIIFFIIQHEVSDSHDVYFNKLIMIIFYRAMGYIERSRRGVA